MAFHWKDGWFFERLDSNGTVRIYHEEPNRTEEPKECDIVVDIDPDSWASIIASVCPLGESADTYKVAQDFHRKGVAQSHRTICCEGIR